MEVAGRGGLSEAEPTGGQYLIKQRKKPRIRDETNSHDRLSPGIEQLSRCMGCILLETRHVAVAQGEAENVGVLTTSGEG